MRKINYSDCFGAAIYLLKRQTKLSSGLANCKTGAVSSIMFSSVLYLFYLLFLIFFQGLFKTKVKPVHKNVVYNDKFRYNNNLRWWSYIAY